MKQTIFLFDIFGNDSYYAGQNERNNGNACAKRTELFDWELIPIFPETHYG